MKNIKILLLLMLSIFLVSCGVNDVKQTTGTLRAFSFETSVKKSDLIALVEINKILEETDTPISQTIIEAKIVTTIKGNEKSEGIIKFVMDGHSKLIFDGFPISVFDSGSQFILFLHKPIGNYNPPLDRELYYLVGGYTGVYQIATIDNEKLVYRRNSGFSDFSGLIDNALVGKVKKYKSNKLKKYEILGDIQVIKKETFVDLINKKLTN